MLPFRCGGCIEVRGGTGEDLGRDLAQDLGGKCPNARINLVISSYLNPLPAGCPPYHTHTVQPSTVQDGTVGSIVVIYYGTVW